MAQAAKQVTSIHLAIHWEPTLGHPDADQAPRRRAGASRAAIHNLIQTLSFTETIVLRIFFRFFGSSRMEDSVIPVGSSRREIGFLAGTFLIGLATLEIALSAAGL